MKTRLTQLTEQPRAQTIFPANVYEDARGAMAWLCAAFGFEEHFVLPGNHGAIAHAELRLGVGMLMLGSETEPGLHARAAQGLMQIVRNTDIYMVVDDIDDHHQRATAADARIVREPADTAYGREYAARDPEGYLWSFGTYRPSW